MGITSISDLQLKAQTLEQLPQGEAHGFLLPKHDLSPLMLMIYLVGRISSWCC